MFFSSLTVGMYQREREMSLVGKLEADLEVKTSTSKFLEIFSTETYELPSISPDIVQSLQILEGEWGTPGFSFSAQYTFDGKSYVIKEVVEDINLVNISITFKVVEGDIMELYKSFKFIVKVTPHILEGSVVHWTLEYEKLNDQIPDPDSLLQALLQLGSDIDAYLSNALQT